MITTVIQMASATGPLGLADSARSPIVVRELWRIFWLACGWHGSLLLGRLNPCESHLANEVLSGAHGDWPPELTS